MRKIVFCLCLGLFAYFSFSSAQAQDRGFGLGVMLGEPSGISGKFWVSKRSAIDFGFGLSVGGDRIAYHGNNDFTRVHLHMDYLYHFFDVIKASLEVPVYFGTGPRFNFAGDYGSSFGWRGVAGIAWLVQKLPIDIFVEAVPVFQVGHKTGLGIEGGVGVRYFF